MFDRRWWSFAGTTSRTLRTGSRWRHKRTVTLASSTMEDVAVEIVEIVVEKKDLGAVLGEAESESDLVEPVVREADEGSTSP
ncbi:unnamed protein product [Arabis nemorensis]|uniref:Uncharacterized protein n=1 Tax=Arabis nemorensis TaxID=586526 RepID=A0A565C262_9BRAS|nr:unnamed protein product [Arabis nemorensis]